MLCNAAGPASGAGAASGPRAAYGNLRPQSVGGHYTSVLRSALLPRSLGGGAQPRRTDGKPSMAGRPPRPPSSRTNSAAASSTTSILQRCKRALGRASGRRSKHASAEVPARAAGLTHSMSSFSSAPEMSTAMSPVVTAPVSRGADAESDADIQMLPPMEAMAEEGEAVAVGTADVPAAAARAAAVKEKRSRRWLPWRRRK